jgi:tRNA G18 (ribose-2'-O)-methylase SpoU
VRGFYGIGVYHPKREVNIGTLWRSAHLLGASFIFTIGRRYSKQPSDVSKVQNILPIFHYLTFDEMIHTAPLGAQIIGIEQSQAAVGLHNFEHPRAAVYLLGAEDHGLPPAVLDRCHKKVQLYAGGRDMAYSLNVSVAGSIVLYDRCHKEA